MTGIAALINGDTKLQAAGVTATASGATITMTDRPTYTVSTSVGATETMKLSPTYAGNTSVAIGERQP